MIKSTMRAFWYAVCTFLAGMFVSSFLHSFLKGPAWEFILTVLWLGMPVYVFLKTIKSDGQEIQAQNSRLINLDREICQNMPVIQKGPYGTAEQIHAYSRACDEIVYGMVNANVHKRVPNIENLVEKYRLADYIYCDWNGKPEYYGNTGDKHTLATKYFEECTKHR